MSHNFLSCDRICRPRWFVGNEIRTPMILCAWSTSRSREQSTKRRSLSENMWKVCLLYSQNNKIVWLSNMADTRFGKFTRCAKVCGRFFPDCALRTLIGWAGFQSHGLFWLIQFKWLRASFLLMVLQEYTPYLCCVLFFSVLVWLS